MKTRASIRWFSIAMLSAVLAACAGVGGSDSGYPTRTITMILPVEAGNAGDLNARALAEQAEEDLGQRIEIENKPGAAQATGISELVNAAADGYTVAFVSTPGFVALSERADRWRPVLMTSTAPQAIFVPADSPYSTLEELAAADNAQVGSGGLTGIASVNIQELARQAESSVEPVPMGGANERIREMLAGTAEAAVGGLTAFIPLVEAGDLRPLAILNDEGHPSLPDAPSATDAGFEGSDFFAVDYFVIVPAETPDDVVETLHEAFRSAAESDDYLEFLDNNAFAPRYLGPEDLEEHLDGALGRLMSVSAEAESG